MDDVPPVNNEVNLDDDDLGVSEINLDDDDDIFKSARLEPEPAKMMPEVVRSNGGAGIQEGVTTSGGGLTNGHHKDQGIRAVRLKRATAKDSVEHRQRVLYISGSHPCKGRAPLPIQFSTVGSLCSKPVCAGPLWA